MKLHKPAFRDRVRDAGPALTLGLMLLLPLVLRINVSWTPEVIASHQRIADAINGVPWTIGSWSGQDVEVPAAAQAILRPNALMSRRYRRIGTEREEMTVVVVHCNDVRDMYGHYPPVCYPNVGWTRDVANERYHEIELAGEEVKIKMYRFTKRLGTGAEEAIRVYSFFVLPGGTIATELDGLGDLIKRPGSYSLGVAQVQCVRSGSANANEDQQVIDEVLNGMSDLFAVLRGERETTLAAGGGKKEGGEG